MLFVAAALVVAGAAIALLGERIFRVALPLIGLIAGVMVGYSGVQAVFGIGVVSLPLAIITGVLVGVLLAILSYLYFNIAVAVLAMVLTCYAMVYLGIALGLSDNGFMLFLMGFAGAVLGLAVAVSTPLSLSLVLFVTSFYGVALVMAGILLAAGNITLDQLQDHGILRAVTSTVGDQFIWWLVWIGGGLVAGQIQATAIARDLGNSSLSYTELEKQTK